MNHRDQGPPQPKHRSLAGVSRGERWAWAMLVIVVIYVATLLVTTYQRGDRPTKHPTQQLE